VLCALGSIFIVLGQVQGLDGTALLAVCHRVYGDFNDTALLTELVGLEI
jgi:hypothetical protein